MCVSNKEIVFQLDRMSMTWAVGKRKKHGHNTFIAKQIHITPIWVSFIKSYGTVRKISERIGHTGMLGKFSHTLRLTSWNTKDFLLSGSLVVRKIDGQENWAVSEKEVQILDESPIAITLNSMGRAAVFKAFMSICGQVWVSAQIH